MSFKAAHCIVVAPISSFSVQFAATIVSRTGKNIVRVAELIRHEAYLPSNQYENDIGLVKVSENIQNPLNDFTVKLPLPGSQFTTGTPAVLIGWGMDETDGNYKTNLQKVDLQIFSSLDCDEIHKTRTVHRTNICGGVPEGGKGQVS
jgi:secreted trypsin-like serine protease